MLMYEQTAGKLAEASKAIWTAVKQGDYETCQKIWREVTGQEVLDHNKTNYTWWMFVATDHIKTASRPTREGTWKKYFEH